MLRKLTRDDTKPPKQPHPNKVKNTKHSFNIGYKDFLLERQFSSKAFFHNKKERILADHKEMNSNQSNFSLAHDARHTGMPLSMTRNDFGPYQFSSADHKAAQKSVLSSAITGSMRDQFGYPSDFRVPGSLQHRDPDFVQVAERSKPLREKKELLKTQFEVAPSKEFRKKSNYGETYVDPSASNALPSITFKHKRRDFNILTGAMLQNRQSEAYPFQKYECYDPAVKQSRTSFNHSDIVVQAVARFDPITGRHLGG